MMNRPWQAGVKHENQRNEILLKKSEEAELEFSYGVDREYGAGRDHDIWKCWNGTGGVKEMELVVIITDDYGDDGVW